jgi:ribonuclease VapC
VIVIDTSAIVAIMLREENYLDISTRLIDDPQRWISPVTFAEIAMVLSRTTSDPKHSADTYIRQAGIQICTIDADQAEWARYAFLTFGKGRHPARLNLGDCFSYAAAKALNAPLLYVGDDFTKTDIRAA